MDNLDQGISVFDKDLRIVALDKPTCPLYPYPESMLTVGLPCRRTYSLNANVVNAAVGGH